MSIASVIGLEDKVIPAIETLVVTFKKLERENEGIVKSGRTHLQDATPITFSQEISGWRSSLEKDKKLIEIAVKELKELALGGTAVGTGLNAPKGFDEEVAKAVSQITGKEFVTAPNKYHALTSKDEIVFAHGALKALACDLMKIANDIRWLASGPRLGLGEITIPENEPGSSIMPGKVNPVIPEVVSQVAFSVIGNDTAITLAAEAGQLELNAFEPVIFYKLFESLHTLNNAVKTLVTNCIEGIQVNRERCAALVYESVGTVTALNPYIGYKKAAELAKEALKRNVKIKDLVIEKHMMDEETLEKILNPYAMTEPKESI